MEGEAAWAANESESDVTQSMHARASECLASECGYVYNKPCDSHHEYDTTCMYELMFPGFDTRPCPELRHVSNMTWGSAMHACLRFPGRRCSGWSNYARAKDDCADVPIHSWVRGVAKRLLYKQLMACGGRWSCAAQSAC